MSGINCACGTCLHLPLDGGFGRRITNARKLIEMHARHGHGPEGKTCGECEHLSAYQPGNAKFFKCNVSGPTRSSASDWRKKWEACGAFTEIGSGNPVSSEQSGRSGQER